MIYLLSYYLIFYVGVCESTGTFFYRGHNINNKNHRLLMASTSRSKTIINNNKHNNNIAKPISLVQRFNNNNNKNNENKNNNDDSSVMVTIKDENQLWPPWPFNLMKKRQQFQNNSSQQQLINGKWTEPSTRAVFWAFLSQRARRGFYQLQRLGGELWFHLPPITPPLLLVSTLPTITRLVERQQFLLPPLITNNFIRKWALASFGFALISWANAEINHNRLLVPLPLPKHYRDLLAHKQNTNIHLLPPFLPENVPISPEEEQLLAFETETATTTTTQQGQDDNDDSKTLPKSLKQQIQQAYQSTPRPTAVIQQWLRVRKARKYQAARLKRTAIYNDLIALQQQLKRSREQEQKSKRRQSFLQTNNNQNGDNVDEENPLGFALVTGASRGIGRALAVELARYEIPLILVARDTKRLQALADDLEQCYGVSCHVLKADLSEPNVAQKIHSCVTDAGLDVDILVNNAGLASCGPLLDTEPLDRILQVNAVTVAKLAQLFGRDMQRRGRGRMLVVSSIMGDVYCGPTVAAYAATKAFEKSLGLAMAKELEPFGIGVTSLLPGAVGDSHLRVQSGSKDALCWKLPFYPKSCQAVASLGIRAMLMGRKEVVPGWQNRFVLKVMKPMLPQRLFTLIIETFWNPPSQFVPTAGTRKRFLPWNSRTKQEEGEDGEGESIIVSKRQQQENNSRRKRKMAKKLPDRILELPPSTPVAPKVVIETPPLSQDDEVVEENAIKENDVEEEVIKMESTVDENNAIKETSNTVTEVIQDVATTEPNSILNQQQQESKNEPTEQTKKLEMVIPEEDDYINTVDPDEWQMFL